MRVEIDSGQMKILPLAFQLANREVIESEKTSQIENESDNGRMNNK
jgi:hypothetical protein